MFLSLKTILFQYLLKKLIYSSFIKKIAGVINSQIKFSNDFEVKMHGFTLYAHSLDRLVALYLWKISVLESYETDVVNSLIKKGMVTIDIGANLGYYTLQLARLTGATGQVYAFEPEPDNFRLLKKNLIVNHFSNVVAVQKAISDKNDSMFLYFCKEHHGNHKIYPSGDKRKRIPIKSTTLDYFLKGKRKPDLIKMDIEGSEYLAIKGMKKTIKDCKHLIIICEFAPETLTQCGCSPIHFLKTMTKQGFTRQLINEKGGKLEFIEDKALVELSKEEKCVNLLFRK